MFHLICFDIADSSNTVEPQQQGMMLSDGHQDMNPAATETRDPLRQEDPEGMRRCSVDLPDSSCPSHVLAEGTIIQVFLGIRRHWLFLADVCPHPTIKRNAETPCFFHHHHAKHPKGEWKLPGLKTFYFISAAFAFQL